MLSNSLRIVELKAVVSSLTKLDTDILFCLTQVQSLFLWNLRDSYAKK